MSKLDILQRIIETVVGGFKLPEDISVDGNKLSLELVAVKVEKPIIINGNVITVNTTTPEGQAVAKAVLEQTDQLLDKGDRAVEAEFGKLVAGAASATRDDSDQQLLERFERFVPRRDLKIIRAALVVRSISKAGGDVKRYKSLIYRDYLTRGNNICNLVSAGYYEDYLEPFYNYLLSTEGEEQANYIFADFYEEAVTQYTFAVFVANRKTYGQLKQEVIQKIQINLLNDQHTLNIHGFGDSNKRTIAQLIDDPDINRLFMSEPDIVALETTYYARLYF